jgi:cytochrome c oxidase subunit 2
MNVIYIFHSSKSSLIHKYLNHGTLIEFIWTTVPAFILIAIAFPSFRLLYLLDYSYSSLNDLIIYILNKY